MKLLNVACATGALVLALLVGCIPGEAEFTMKTSEVRKALQGGIAHVSVRESQTTVLSNANRRVSYGRFTNELDAVKALVATFNATEKAPGFGRDAFANDQLKIWVEESPKALPRLRCEAQIGLALGTDVALKKGWRENAIDDLCALEIDAKTGALAQWGGTGESPAVNARGAAFFGRLAGRTEILETFFDPAADGDLFAVDRALEAVVLPTWRKQLSCIVVGDSDEPLFVVADDVKVNGRLVRHYAGAIKKGETVRFDLDKEKHAEDGGLRFFKKAQGNDIK